MSNRGLFLLATGFLVLCFAGFAQGWQGRMAGMGDPFGLVQDESDFLIHPAEIAEGNGVNFYGNYRFNYQDTTSWDYTMEQHDIPTGALISRFPFRTSGSDREHDALVGAAIPLWSGRLGLFLQYAHRDGDFDGTERVSNTLNTYQFDHKIDDFTLSALYAQPVGSWKLGGEVQLAYNKQRNGTSFVSGANTPDPQIFLNNIIGSHIPFLNTFPFEFPYDSKWWEAQFKLSLEGQAGAGKLSITPRGGFIFSGDNDLRYRNFFPASSFTLESIDFNGGVTGWNIGGDVWYRIPLDSDLSLPLLLRVDYDTKKWDGAGLNVPLGNIPYTYDSKGKNLQIEVGGGVDKEFEKGSRVSAGLYYDYLKSDNSFMYSLNEPFFSQRTDHTEYPDQREHRIVLKLAGETELSSSFTGRMGLNAFYGWVKEDYTFVESFSPPPSVGTTEHISPDGFHWGVLASLGGTIKQKGFSIEPFVNCGYQKLDVDAHNGVRTIGLTSLLLTMDKKREEWSIGAGFSVRF